MKLYGWRLKKIRTLEYLFRDEVLEENYRYGYPNLSIKRGKVDEKSVPG